MKLQFTDRDLRNAKRYVEALSKSGAQYARMGEVTLYTNEQENDTMLFGGDSGACITLTQGVTVSLVPRPCAYYSVQVPYTVRGGYWEPDETDFKEVALCASLFEAIAQLYLELASEYCDNVAMGVQYEADQEVIEDV